MSILKKRYIPHTNATNDTLATDEEVVASEPSVANVSREPTLGFFMPLLYVSLQFGFQRFRKINKYHLL